VLIEAGKPHVEQYLNEKIAERLEETRKTIKNDVEIRGL